MNSRRPVTRHEIETEWVLPQDMTCDKCGYKDRVPGLAGVRMCPSGCGMMTYETLRGRKCDGDE